MPRATRCFRRGSNLYPRLGLNPGFTHYKNSSNEPNITRTTSTNYNDLLLTGAGSWEPDFLGPHPAHH